MKKVLIACEHSGIVRTAFEKQGCFAVSADLLPTEQEGYHYQGDARDLLHSGWDLLIAHPPCQYLTFAGMRYWNDEGRQEKRDGAYKLFLDFLNAPIKHICVENPRGYPMRFIKPSQEIHPYFFGDAELKRTCLWLKNLPKLVHIKTTDLFEYATHTEKPLPAYVQENGKKRYFTEASFNKKNAWKVRSRTFEGIAQAMATQWTKYLTL